MQLRVPNEAFTRLRLRDCAALCEQMDASRELRGFVTANATFETLLQSMINHEFWTDAVSLLAHGMAPRPSVWWAAQLCGARLSGMPAAEPSAQAQTQVLELAKQWVMTPEEDIREAAYRAVSGIADSTPAYWTGMAVFWATGNITPDAGAVTPPPPYLYARGVSAAITLAANLAGEDRVQVYEQALRSGMDIAGGGTGDLTADA